jgi:dethiobiotin synthase
VRKGLFVTGTDTGVGKTVLSAALLCRYRNVAPVRYWKPVQTGIEQDDDTAEVRRLADASDTEILNEGVRLRHPVSPHLAARLAGDPINLLRLYRMLPKDAESSWIVEGAGGALVPLNNADSITDLITMLEIPVLVAARSGLGTINHTRLTVEALRARSLFVAGVVMIGEPNADNAEAIEHYAKVPVLGQMPRFDPLTPEALHAWSQAHFDPAGYMVRLLVEQSLPEQSSPEQPVR